MPDLATFGEALLRLCPTTGERLVTTPTLEIGTGGAEFNVAIVAANLGADAAYLTKLPRNPLARRIERELLANGVETAVVWDDRPSSRQGVYFLELGAEPRNADVIYDRAGSAVTTVTPDELNLDLVRDATYFCTSGITPALSDTLEETTADLLAVAAEADVRTVFDVNYRAKLWSETEAAAALGRLLPLVDVICSAERDARGVLGYEGDAEAVVTDLRADYDAELAVLTQGADGAIATDGETVYRQAAYGADTIDPVGTGDAFLGGFLAHRLSGDPVSAALEAAVATAALSRTVKGDWAVLSRDEVAAVRDGESGISR